MYWGPLLFVGLYLSLLFGFCLFVVKELEPSVEAIRIEEESEDDQ